MTDVELAERIGRVRERIGEALARAGRPRGVVTVVAVTKTYPASAVLAALAAGIRDVGENRVQELEEKVGEVGRDAARWHLIGNLQRNKVRRAAPLFDLLHSLDSLRLARELSSVAVASGTTVRALVQVNTSGETSKSGFEEAEAMGALAEICALPGLSIEGMMTMAPLTEDERVLRGTFGRARLLAEEAARQIPTFSATHLSMGMSNDFEIAVEEGSTLVRLGTVLFGDRTP